jgi:hypothetical protein
MKTNLALLQDIIYLHLATHHTNYKAHMHFLRAVLSFNGYK